ncbi:DUF1176 domain-containing protein [Phenylobacterium aquaticum]|uniref:DUF1176 domain-containing protein n=3 Tax=Phenylobacterium aquaticum TaxID=1763816 RepID=UPI0026E9C4CA|nr:DUF1176 domain-containing protein [Phenylobacterium aquaticum]
MRRDLSMAMLVLGAVLAGRAQAGEATFKDWDVVCDNVRTCTAFGLTEEGAETDAFLKIERTGAPNAAPRLSLAVQSDTATAETWALKVDGRPIAGLGALKARRTADDSFLRAPLSAVQGAALTAALLNGGSLTVKAGAEDEATISLAGSAAALRWMDDQQKRAGSVTALAAKGPKPASSLPPVPEVPLIRPPPSPSQAGVGDVLPKSVRARFGPDCEANLPADRRDPISARLAPGVILWGDVCFNAAYQSVYELFLADEAGGHVRPLLLDAELGEKPDNQLIEAAFDRDTLTLSDFYKGRGIGDCGAGASWTWDGKTFRLSAQTTMSECRGVPQDDWPISFVSRQK